MSKTCVGGCGADVLADEGPLAMCCTCFYATEIATREGVDHLRDLLGAPPRVRLLARASDLIQRSGVSDADEIVRSLELLLAA